MDNEKKLKEEIKLLKKAFSLAIQDYLYIDKKKYINKVITMYKNQAKGK